MRKIQGAFFGFITNILLFLWPASALQPPTSLESAYLPVSGILESLPKCEILFTRMLDPVNISSIKQPHMIYEQDSNRMGWSPTGSNLHGNSTSKNLVKYLQCSAIVVVVPYAFDSYYDYDTFGILELWKASIRYPGVVHFTPFFLSNETFPTKIHLFFLPDIKYFRELVENRFESEWSDKISLQLQFTYAFLHSSMNSWNGFSGNFLAESMITQTFIMCWSCEKVEIILPEGSGKEAVVVSYFLPYSCKLPDKCRILSNPRDSLIVDNFKANAIPWQLWWESRTDDPKFRKDPVDKTTFSKISVRLENALAHAFFPFVNSTFRSMAEGSSSFRLEKILPKRTFHDSFVIVTTEGVHVEQRMNFLRTFLEPLDKLTWISLLLCLTWLNVAYAYLSWMEGATFSIPLVRGISIACGALVDQWQFHEFAKYAIGRTTLRKILAAGLCMLMCAMIIITNSGYKAVMKSNFIAARVVNSTNLKDWSMYSNFSNMGIIDQYFCEEIRQWHDIVQDPLGIIQLPRLVINRGLSPYGSHLLYNDPECPRSTLSDSEHRACQKNGSIVYSMVRALQYTCAPDLGYLISFTYNLETVNPFTPKSSKNMRPSEKTSFPVGIRRLIGARKAFFMTQQDFPWYWQFFKKVMESTNLTFAHTRLNEEAMTTNDINIAPATGFHSYEAQWMIRRIKHIYQSGIPQFLKKWDKIKYPPLQIRPYESSQEEPAIFEPISLQGGVFTGIFLGFMAAMVIPLIIFLGEKRGYLSYNCCINLTVVLCLRRSVQTLLFQAFILGGVGVFRVLSLVREWSVIGLSLIYRLLVSLVRKAKHVNQYYKALLVRKLQNL